MHDGLGFGDHRFMVSCLKRHNTQANCDMFFFTSCDLVSVRLMNLISKALKKISTILIIVHENISVQALLSGLREITEKQCSKKSCSLYSEILALASRHNFIITGFIKCRCQCYILCLFVFPNVPMLQQV